MRTHVVSRWLCATIALASGAGPSGGQTSRADPTDVQAWYGATARLDLPNRWETSLQYRLRTIDNASRVRGSYVTGEVQFRPVRALRLLANYRLAAVNDGTYHRYAIGSTAGHDFGQTQLSLRGLVQYQKQNFDDNDEASSDEDLFYRTRLELEQRLNGRTEVYLSTEPYFIAGPTNGNSRVDNWRNTVGVKYEFARDRRLDLFYIYRPDYGKKTYNRMFHIVGVDVRFDVKWP